MKRVFFRRRVQSALLLQWLYIMFDGPWHKHERSGRRLRLLTRGRWSLKNVKHSKGSLSLSFGGRSLLPSLSLWINHWKKVFWLSTGHWTLDLWCVQKLVGVCIYQEIIKNLKTWSSRVGRELSLHEYSHLKCLTSFSVYLRVAPRCQAARRQHMQQRPSSEI